MSSRLGLALLTAALVACQTTPTPAGNLADPAALAVAPSATIEGGKVILIAEGDGRDLRAFVPSTRQFVRGPNAISALSIPLTAKLNGQTLPSFRPQYLAGGSVPGSGGSGTATKGYAIVAGAAPRVAVVDTQTLHTTVSAADAAACAAGTPSLSCLPEGALDVATTLTKAYVLLATDTAGKLCAAGHQCVLVLAPSIENDTVVLSRDPQAPIDLGVGHFNRLRVDVGLSGTMIYASDSRPVESTDAGASDTDAGGDDAGSVDAGTDDAGPVDAGTDDAGTPDAGTDDAGTVDAGQSDAGTSIGSNEQGVTTVPIEGGAVTRLATAGGVRVATPTPDGKYILAVLADGRVQTLDALTSAPVTDGMSPLQPLDLGSPAVDILFLPCNSDMTQPCQKAVRDSAGTITRLANTAVLAMGDGTVVPLFPESGRPQVFSPTNLAGNNALPDIGDVGFSDTSFATAPVKLTVTGLTLGITRSENIAVTYRAGLPGFVGRPALVSPGTGGLTLMDFGAFATPGDTVPVAHDLARLHVLGSGCPQLDNVAFEITALTADTLTLELPAGVSCDTTNLAVAYDAVAADETAGAWVVQGSFTGFMQRVALGTAKASSTPFRVAGTRRYYPPGVGNGGQAFNATLLRQTEDPLVEGMHFSFTTSSGFTPFAMSSTATQFGLAIGLAGLNDTLYVTILGANSLTEIVLPNYPNAGSVTDYR